MNFKKDLAEVFLNPSDFSNFARIKLRSYQEEVVGSITYSILHQKGYSLVVMFPRQSGKNELQAQIEAYLLALYATQPVEIVKISPTWRPQSQNAMRRLERVLNTNEMTKKQWKRESGYVYRVGEARILFLSGAREANIIGATASLMLEVDEAQSISIEKFDREIAPMAASTNATRVFWGTAWTAQTLLGRELRASQAEEIAERAQCAQKAAGEINPEIREAIAKTWTRRVFRINADMVAREVPSYGKHVAQQVMRMGRGHPSIRTQYFSEEIDAEAGLFPPEHMAMMDGGAAFGWQERPRDGEIYAFLLDVGGEENQPGGEIDAFADAERTHGREHDATALVIVAVDRGSLADPLLRAPTYRVVNLRQWHGERHSTLYAQIQALARAWNPRRLVIDATGLGAGLADFLDRALPGRVLRYEFNTLTKSRLGWQFIEVVESGRFRLPRASEQSAETLLDLLRSQFRACQYQMSQRQTQALRWGVPEGARDPLTGRPIHDDLLLAAALSARLDRVEWPMVGGEGSGIIQGKDPLAQKERF